MQGATTSKVLFNWVVGWWLRKASVSKTEDMTLGTNFREPSP